MYYSNIDFKVVYIDPLIAVAGDGSSPLAALQTLPSTAAALSDNTCFLIRRSSEDGCVSLPAGTCPATNLMIWGMPKSDDPEYLLVPAEARNAWGGDTAEYANVKALTTSATLTLASVKHFSLHRIFLFRDNTAAGQPIFTLTATGNLGAVSIDQCKFGAKGLDLGDPALATQITTSYCRAYIHVKSARVFSLKNTIIHHVANSGGYGSGSVNSIYLETANFVAVNQVEVFVTTAQYGGGGPMGSIGVPLQMSSGGSGGSGGVTGAFASFENITFNILLNGSYEYLPQLFTGSTYSHVTMRNIRIETVRQLGPTPAKLSIASPLVNVTGVDEFRLEKFTANLPECWLVESAGRVLVFTGSSSGMGSSGIPGYEKIVKDITIQLAEANGLDATGNGWYYSQLQNSQYLNYYAALELTFSNYYGGCESVLADNVTVNHPRGVAFYGSGMQMNNSRFKGSVRCLGMVANLSSVDTVYPGYALYVKDNSTVRVGVLTLGKANADLCGGNVNDPGVASNFSDRGFLYVESSNAPLRGNTPTSTTTDNMYGVICGNETDPGHFVHRTENYICDTWNVHRTGGATASLKLWNNSCNSTSDLALGKMPFKGMQLTPETVGVKTLKIYVAVKHMTDLADLYRRLIVQAVVPNGAGVDMYFSPTDASWAPDASEWKNDSDLTAYVLSMPLRLHSTDPIDVKIHFNWYSQAGFAYIDPEFKLE